MPSTSTLFFNGRILTGERLLSAVPEYAQALLVRNGLIVAAGDKATLSSELTPSTERVDLAGAFAMPGFNNAHLHLGEGARLLREVDLAGTPALEVMLARIGKARDAALPGAWLTGGGWDESLWPDARLPSRRDLDSVTGDYPAVFGRIDVHIAVANSAALRLAGITPATVAPEGSAIDRDPSGEPTGILREAGARALVERHIPPAPRASRMRALGTVMQDALRHGITSVQDNSTDEDVAALRALHASGELPLRVCEWLPFDAPLHDLSRRRAELPGDRFLRAGMLKAFLDGSLGSRTAALLAPYGDAPEQSGIALYAQERLDALAVERARAGFDLGFHAIGDRALEMALAAFESVRRAAHGKTARLRIEHAQVAAADAFSRAQQARVIASVQPNHLLSDLRWAETRLGPERASRAYAWRSFLQAGVPLAFGTDYPVEPVSPFRGIYAAVTRQAENSGPAFFPEQRLTIHEALYAATQGAAHAEGAADWKGRLSPGHVADFVVMDRDLVRAAADPASILATKVLRTIIGGRTVDQRD